MCLVGGNIQGLDSTRLEPTCFAFAPLSGPSQEDLASLLGRFLNIPSLNGAQVERRTLMGPLSRLSGTNILSTKGL